MTKNPRLVLYITKAVAPQLRGPRTPGLRPFRKMVTRGGKTFEQTYYTKPGELPPQQRQPRAEPPPEGKTPRQRAKPTTAQPAAPRRPVETRAAQSAPGPTGEPPKPAVTITIPAGANPALSHDAPRMDYPGPFAEPTLEQCRAFIEEHRPTLEKTLGELKAIVATIPRAEATGRLKRAENLLVKIQGKRRAGRDTYGLGSVTDVIGARVTVRSINAMREAEQKILDAFKVLEHLDFAETPRQGDRLGYRSIHVVVEVDGRPAEIQLRTPNQSRWADWCHDTLYKKHYLVEQLGQAVVDRLEPVMNAYAKKMSEYYAHVDQGKPVPEKLSPDCPRALQIIAMCMEAARATHVLPALIQYGHGHRGS